VKLEYSHCVKWTQGQLDQPPFSAYQLKQVEVETGIVRADTAREIMQEDEWCIQYLGETLAMAIDFQDAIHQAAYKLMYASREDEISKATKGTP
jgi:hypothetical protein